MVVTSDTGWLIGFLLSIIFWMMVVLWEKIEFMKINKRLDRNGFCR